MPLNVTAADGLLWKCRPCWWPGRETPEAPTATFQKRWRSSVAPGLKGGRHGLRHVTPLKLMSEGWRAPNLGLEKQGPLVHSKGGRKDRGEARERHGDKGGACFPVVPRRQDTSPPSDRISSRLWPGFRGFCPHQPRETWRRPEFPPC